MSLYFFNYSAILGKAMQRVVHSVLSHVSANGLPGQHHFYITFSTRAEGVILPAKILARFPERITIVLQHEFYNLKTRDAEFEVELVFNGTQERVVVPFDALIEFTDPYANFSMQFDANEWHNGNREEDDEEEEEMHSGNDAVAIKNIQQHITNNLATNFIQAMQQSNDDDGEEARDSAKQSGKLIFIDDYLNKA